MNEPKSRGISPGGPILMDADEIKDQASEGASTQKIYESIRTKLDKESFKRKIHPPEMF